jgi:integrase
MASIWKQTHSKYFTACFRDGSGRQRRVSTKKTNRKEAQRIADDYESAARGRRAYTHIKQVLEHLHEESHRDASEQELLTRCEDWLRGKEDLADIGRIVTRMGEDLPPDSIQKQSLRAFCEQWLRIKEKTVGSSTYDFYSDTLGMLLKFLGGDADLPVSEINRNDLVNFRNARASKVSASTVNHDLVAVRQLFRAARRDKIIQDDPTEFLENIYTGRKKEGNGRRAFTIPEIQSLLTVAKDIAPEWVSLIKLGIYTGGRLGDIALLQWRNVDLVREEIRYVSQKVGKHICVPIVGALKSHLLGLKTSDIPGDYLHPIAAGWVTSRGRSARLSQEFADLLVEAGLRDPKLKVKGQRTKNPLSFHCLRHTTVSLLKDAGVPQAVVEELVGHSSVEISALYTHVGQEALMKAGSALPAL